MANDYPTLVTLAGRALEVQAKASNVPLKLTHMAVGDAGDNSASGWHPTGAETTLVRERWRGQINTLMQHPDHPAWLVAEAVLPDDAGGWWIREVGLFTETGTLYAIAKYPPTFKPVLADGVAKMLYIRMIFKVTNAASVTLQVDPSIVLATRSFVQDKHDAALALINSHTHATQDISDATATGLALVTAQDAAAARSSICAEPRFSSVIDLTRLPTNRFYPVWWKSAPDGAGLHKLQVTRSYHDDLELEPFGPGVEHLAGLTLAMVGVGYSWSGSANFLRVKVLTQRYYKTVRNIAFSMKCSSVGPVPGHPPAPWATGTECPAYSGLYLRGGMNYQFYSNQAPLEGYSRQAGEVIIWSGVQDGVGGRWWVKSYDINDAFLGSDYDDFNNL